MDPRNSFSQFSRPSYASDEQESAYLSRARGLNRIRVGIATIILVAAVATVGVEGAPLSRYNKTVSFENSWLPLWPLNLDVRQTNAILACAALITFQTLIYIIVALIPSPKPRIHLLNTLTSIVSLAGFVTSLVGIIFAIYLPSSSYPAGFSGNETIHSWTCKWQSLNGVSVQGSNGQPLAAPDNFASMCMETRAGFILLGLLIGLEIVLGVSGVSGWWLARNVDLHRKDVGLGLSHGNGGLEMGHGFVEVTAKHG